MIIKYINYSWREIMKSIKIILILILFFIIAIGFMACNIIFGSECPEVNSNAPHSFWTVNLNAGLFGEPYCEISTSEPYEGNYANVYMEYDNYDSTVIQRVADEFDMMYPTITNKFGDPVTSDNNSYQGGTEKVTILLLDIIDGYDGVLNTSYVGGYFYSVDYLTQESLEDEGYTDKTNQQAILYIDINPQDVTKDDVYSTVAHEFQHMINFSENVLDGGSATPDLDLILNDDVPTWIDEGFAMASEHIWATDVKNITNPEEWPVKSRIDYFNHPDYFVEGNPLIKWIRSDSGYDVLSNYSTSFLFFQYLRIHHPDDSDIFKSMMDDTNDDIDMLNPIIDELSFTSNFEELLQSWMMANVINSGTGELGYLGEAPFDTVSAVIGSEEKTWGFYPGSYIYRMTADNPTLPNGVEYIRFDNGGIDSGGDYIAIYNPDTNPNGGAIDVTVPSGDIVSMKGLPKPPKTQRVDWLIKKPISETGIDWLELPIDKNK